MESILKEMELLYWLEDRPRIDRDTRPGRLKAFSVSSDSFYLFFFSEFLSIFFFLAVLLRSVYKIGAN